MYKLKRVVFEFSPVLLIVSVNLFNLAIQYIFQDSQYSGFGSKNLKIYCGLLPLFSIACISLLLGAYSFSFVYTNRASFKKLSNKIIDRKKLILLVDLNIALQLIFILVTQYYLGHANIINLWTGRAHASGVEIALRQSPFGVHGILLIISLGGVMIWHASSLIKLDRNVRTKLLLAVTIFSFISQGKIQGLLFLIATYLSIQKNFLPFIRKFLLFLFLFLFLFFVTRLLRNQGGGFSFSIASFIFMTFGLYMGSPFLNTSYVLEHELFVGNELEFFKYLIPQKLNLIGNFSLSLPDPSSPLGLFGHGLLLGSRGALFLYCFILGLFIRYIWVKSESSLAMKLFAPFLFVACGFSFLYDHFMNFMLFWIPFFGSILMSNFLKKRDLDDS